MPFHVFEIDFSNPCHSDKTTYAPCFYQVKGTTREKNTNIKLTGATFTFFKIGENTIEGVKDIFTGSATRRLGKVYIP